MRSLPILAALALTACAGHAPPSQAPQGPRGVPYVVLAADEAKLGGYLKEHWRAGHLTEGYYTPLVIEATIDAQARQLIESLGGRYLQTVTVTPAGRGALAAKHVEPGTAGARFLVMIPNQALRFLVAQPWIVSMNAATSYPGPPIDPEVSRRLDPMLMSALTSLGPGRPYSVGGLGQVKGCITEDELAAMRATGATISLSSASASCASTVFGFAVPTDQLIALASLPFIVTLESHHQPVLQ